MRGGRALIQENIDGFPNPPVFRRSPHLLNLAYSAPYGLSGDFPDLPSFIKGAVTQHFPRTLARRSDGSSPDFRVPSVEELHAIEVFLLAQEFPAGADPNKFDLARFATTEKQRKGREDFFAFGCVACHGGPGLNETTAAILGKPVGVNASFNTGASDPALPCEPPSAIGLCGSREFSTPQLFNLPNLGPLFHSGSVRTVGDAVGFYLSSEFGNSPSNEEFIGIGIGVVPTEATTAFLEGLVLKPYELRGAPVRFGAQPRNSGASGTRQVALINTGDAVLSFEEAPCRITGANLESFSLVDCPLGTPIAPGETRNITVTFFPVSEGMKSAILEVFPRDTAPSGVDLFGVGGTLGAPPKLTELRERSGAVDGGTAVAIRGENFGVGATVAFGGVDAGYVDVLSPTLLSVHTGRHAPGVVDVEVTNPDGQSGVLPRSFTYIAP